MPLTTDPFAIWPPTRAAGLSRLAAFVPSAGAHYATHRNNDLGPQDRSNVSLLSPYLRHRLVTEDEVLRAVLAAHTYVDAQSFVHEVVWRTYFKGHLETRPQIWDRYRIAVRAAHTAVEGNAGLRKAYGAAIEGRTGIEGFDDWVAELQATGYLHNHARMWFASIWMFTLRLPWVLGADWMYRHLLDGDAASNTLSWRWVGGLKTAGKTYLARPDNIRSCTNGRFNPTGLATFAAPLEEPDVGPAQPLHACAERAPTGPVGLLLTEDDLAAASLLQASVAAGTQIVAIAGGHVAHARSEWPVAPQVVTYTQACVAEGLVQAGVAFAAPTTLLPDLSAEAILAWARDAGVTTVVTPYAPVGPSAEALQAAAADWGAQGLRLVPVRRAFDTLIWPHGTKGFFGLKDKIPGLLTKLGVTL